MQTYRQFYNLTRQPFTKQITPLYHYRQLAELQKHLCGLCEEGGIGLVSGQVGMGKTSAVRDYLGTLDERAFHIFYCGKTYDVKGIVKEFISSVGVKPAFYRNDIFLQTSNLVERLYEEHRKRSIFVVDELCAEQHNSSYASCIFMRSVIQKATQIQGIAVYYST